MPRTQVHFYRDDGAVPVRDWLAELLTRDRKAAANCIAVIRRLAEAGHELRRPQADYLRDGIYELRAKRGRVNYRLLYFFHGRNITVLSHALTKEDRVNQIDIDRAIQRKKKYEKDPEGHTAREEIQGA